MTLTEDTVRLLIMGAVLLFLWQGIWMYGVMRLLLQGPLFRRQHKGEEVPFRWALPRGEEKEIG